MRVDEIVIDGFGRWHDTRIVPDPGLTVVHGDNEAGKTTLLAFVRAILFGFESGRYPALAGGRRGGRLAMTMADGRRFRIERHGDRGGEGTVLVIGEDGVDRGAATLPRLLHGVEASVYRNIFAFRLDELAQFQRLTEGDVAARIYGAGLGTGGSSAIAVENALRAEAAQLFKSGGHNPAVNGLLRELEEVESALGTLNLPAKYAERQAHRATCEAERASLSRRIAERTMELRRLQRLLDGWQPWLALRTATEALGDREDPGPIPASAVADLSRLGEALRFSEDRLAQLGVRRARLEEAWRQAEPDETLLAHADAAAAVLAERPEQREREVALGRATAETTAADAELSAAVARLGDGWDEDRVAALDSSVAVRSALTGRFRDLLEGSVRDVRRTESALEIAAAAAEASRARLTALNAAAPDGADERSAALADLDAALARMTDRPAPRPEAATARRAPALFALGILAIAATAAIALYAAGLATLAVLAALAGLVAAAIVWRGAAVSGGDPRVGDEASDDRRAVAGAAQVLGLGSAWQAADLLRVRGQVSVAQARLATVAAEREIHAEQLVALEAQERNAAIALTAAQAAAEAARAAWNDWLRSHGLPAEVDREAALAVLDAGLLAQEALRRRSEARRQAAELHAAVAAFQARVGSLMASIGWLPPEPAELDAALGRLASALRAAEERRETRQRLDAQLTELRDEEAAVGAARDRAAEERRQLLASSHARDEADLRDRAARTEEWRRLSAAAAGAQEALAGLSGPGAALERFLADLAGVEDSAALSAAATSIGAEIEELSAARDRVIHEIGSLERQIADLEASVEASDLRQRRADLLACLEREAERWSVLALAVALLERTRRRYEREHRPGVIRAAEAYVAEWTDGRYCQIVAPLGGAIEALERADGTRVPLDGLSRGTQEQLYLALRFGLIEHFAAEAEPLPIVMDEILVNFDDRRAARAARSIEVLAARHQILYFTCRTSTPLRAGHTLRLDGPAPPALIG